MKPFLLILLALLMDASTILNAVESALADQIQSSKGTLVIAETLEDAIEMLQIAPNDWRVVLTMDGDQSSENCNAAGLIKATLVAYVQAPKGLERPRRSLSHANRRDASPSFFTRRDWIIRKIRGLTLSHSEIDSLPTTFAYQGSTWFKIENMPMFRTMACSFDITYALDDPASDTDGTDPVVLPVAFKIVAAADEFYIVAFNGGAHGRVPRYNAVNGDPGGTATGYAITAATDEFYTVGYDGNPDGRIPRFLNA